MINNILLKSVNWLGEAVMSCPVIGDLKTLFPYSTVSILTLKKLASFYQILDFVDEVIPYENFFEAKRKIKNRKWDLIIILPTSFNSAFITASAKAEIKIGYSCESRDIFLTHPIFNEKQNYKNLHRVEYYYQILLEIMKIFNINTTLKPTLPEISINKIVQQRILEKFNLNQGNYIGFNPGATYGISKQWAPENFIQIGKEILKKSDAKILIFGNNTEKQLCDFIKNGIGDSTISLAGLTDILELSYLISICKLFISNDTGPMHLANLLRIPTIVIFGSTNPKQTSPYGRGSEVIYKKTSCSPCYKRVCPYGDYKCLKIISVDEVLSVFKILNNDKQFI